MGGGMDIFRHYLKLLFCEEEERSLWFEYYVLTLWQDLNLRDYVS